MNITRKKIVSSACGIVLAAGLIVILVILTGPLTSYFPSSIQNSIPSFIFIFSLFVVAPLLARRLDRQDDIKKILGWTLMGTGAEFILFPVSFLFAIISTGSPGALIVMVVIIAFWVVFGVPAGLIGITIGMSLIKQRKHHVAVQNRYMSGDE